MNFIYHFNICIQMIESRDSTLCTIICGRSYRILRSRFNSDFDEGLEIILQRTEGGQEIPIAPNTNRLRIILESAIKTSNLVSQRNTAFYIEL